MAMGKPRRPRILFLDAYDSFANNITALLATLLQADVHVLPIDAALAPAAFCAELACYDAVVCGPGPGSPDCPADIGLMKHVWQTADDDEGKGRIVPSLGICLGFQSLVAAHDGHIRRLRSGGLHGMVRPVEVAPGADIFAGVAAPFRATLYHSLGADIGQDDIADGDWPAARWQPAPRRASSNLVPLAWVEEPVEAALADDVSSPSSPSSSPTAVERILMGVRHRALPFWGLQYHPESVCTDPASHVVLVNWFRAAMQWNAEHGRVRAEPSVTSTSKDGLVARQATKPSLLSLQPPVFPGESSDHGLNGHGTNDHRTNGHRTNGHGTNDHSTNGSNGANGNGKAQYHLLSHSLPSRFVSETIPLPDHVEVPDIVEVLQAGCADRDEPEQIILDSASATASRTSGNSTDNDEAVRGRFSIVALDVGAALRIEYRTGDRFATVRLPQGPDRRDATSQDAITVPLYGSQTIWQLLAEFHEARRLPLGTAASPTHETASPFLGGFMGYVSYEQGLGDIGIPLSDNAGIVGGGGGGGHDRPDLCWAWVTRSVVVDHVLGLVHVQHLDDGEVSATRTNGGKSHAIGLNGKKLACRSGWVDGTVAQLQASVQWKQQHPKCSSNGLPTRTMMHNTKVVRNQTPDVQAYEDKVRACQEHIAAGDSYELCLTDETRITTVSSLSASTSWSASSSSWHYFRTLRKKNPAPFASYLRLGSATLVSSSPERFLCFSPGPAAVHRGPETMLCSMRPMKGTVRRSPTVATLAQAEALLHVPKEEAENLMIVDLVRHDLHGVCGPGHVAVPRLLQVEPYGHVFQMVSVVEGVLTRGAVGAPHSAPHTGLDVLAASLPPGSMTGAPKKRSCALLHDIERQSPSPRTESEIDSAYAHAPGERSLYSGVVGYLCVTGRGDWSVTIRSLFRWDDETTFSFSSSGDDSDSDSDKKKRVRHDVWHIGAGGAVTILSTPEGERDEMFTKLAGPLSVFGS